MERVRWMDTMRGVGCLFVLFAHIVTTHERFGAYTNGCGKIGVWLFLVLAGYMTLFRQKDRESSVKGVAGFYARRLVKLYPTYLIGLVLAVLVGLVADMASLLRHLILLEGNVHFWYMAVIVKFYLLAPFIQILYRRVQSDTAFFSLLVFGAGVLLVTFSPANYPENSILLRWYVPVFFYGMMLFIVMDKTRDMKNSGWWDVMAVLSFLVICAMTPPARKLFWGIEPSSYLQNKYYLIGIIWCVILFAISKSVWLLKWLDNSRILHFLGEISFPVYILHYEILHYLLRFELGFLPVLLITVGVTLVLSWLTHRYVEKGLYALLCNRKTAAMLLVLMFCITLTGCTDNRRDTPEDFGLTLSTVEIAIPELAEEKSYLFMADNQAAFDGREDLGWFGSGAARTFKNEAGIPSADRIEDYIAYANAEQVDGVLLGGDIIDYYSDENVQVLEEKLSALDMPYLYCYGNHDSYVSWENCFVDDNPHFLSLFADGDCEFQMIDEGDYAIVAIRNYQKDGTAQVSPEALDRFREVCAGGKPIVLMCHVPIYTAEADGLWETATDVYGSAFKQYDAGGFGTVDESLLMGYDCGYELTDASKEFLDLVLGKDSPVVAVLSGHLHREWSGSIGDGVLEYVAGGAFDDKGAVVRLVSGDGKQNGAALDNQNGALDGETPQKQFTWQEENVIIPKVDREVTLLWYGTSIPQGNKHGNYPDLVSELLGDKVTVYNISKSASVARAGSYKDVCEDDRMGYKAFAKSFRMLMKSASLSREEKQQIYDDWDRWSDVFDYDGHFDTKSDNMDLYLSCSYDGDLREYLNQYPIDYVVYDMGYNDVAINNYTDVMEITDIPEDLRDRRYYIGASMFLFDRIKEYSPDTEIIIAGHYSDSDYAGVAAAQQELSQLSGYPIYKTWERTGWTNETITVNGRWEDGYFVEDGTERQMTVIERWCPDGIHPGEDYSQRANTYLAKIHAGFLYDIMSANEK